MVQVPTATKVKVEPETVQVDNGVEVNVTLCPLLELALSVNGLIPIVLLPGEVKVIVWVDFGSTV